MSVSIPVVTQSLVDDGNAYGNVIVADPTGFVRTAICTVSAAGQPTRVAKIASIVGGKFKLVNLDGSTFNAQNYRLIDSPVLTQRAQSVTGAPANGKISFPTGGASDVVGNATLVGGTKVVATKAITANSIVILTPKTAGGTPGTLVYSLQAGTSFTITSSSGTDTSTVSFAIFN
jgi:hypothetical protein